MKLVLVVILIAAYSVNCQHSCDRIPSTNALTCSGRGSCLSQDVCDCDNSYYGKWCQHYAPEGYTRYEIVNPVSIPVPNMRHFVKDEENMYFASYAGATTNIMKVDAELNIAWSTPIVYKTGTSAIYTISTRNRKVVVGGFHHNGDIIVGDDKTSDFELFHCYYCAYFAILEENGAPRLANRYIAESVHFSMIDRYENIWFGLTHGPPYYGKVRKFSMNNEEVGAFEAVGRKGGFSAMAFTLDNRTFVGGIEQDDNNISDVIIYYFPKVLGQEGQIILKVASKGADYLHSLTLSSDETYLYIAGAYLYTTMIGSISIRSIGSSDIFLAKMNTETFEVVWAISAGSIQSDNILSISVLDDDSFLISARICIQDTQGDRATNATFGELHVLCSNEENYAIVKYDKNGKEVFALHYPVQPLLASGTNVAAFDISKRVSIGPDVFEAGTTSIGIIEEIACFGMLWNDPLVCTSHGKCTEKDTCVCEENYTGHNCSYFIRCDYSSMQSEETCSGKGKCNMYGQCECENSFIGDYCQISSICFGRNETDSCSGKGYCDTPNHCQCDEGYTGDQCQYHLCFSLDERDPLVCSGNGSCVARDKCNCSYGYIGDQCEFVGCFGVRADNKSVCNGHGECTMPDTCLCTNEYTGMNCEVAPCERHQFCSGNGKICDNISTCKCDSGWFGLTCNTPICNGISANDTNSCYRNGTCISPDTCYCWNNGKDGCEDYTVYTREKACNHPLDQLREESFVTKVVAKKIAYANNTLVILESEQDLAVYENEEEKCLIYWSSENGDYQIVERFSMLVVTECFDNSQVCILNFYELNSLIQGDCEPFEGRSIHGTKYLKYRNILNMHYLFVQTLEKFSIDDCTCKTNVVSGQYAIIAIPQIFSTSLCEFSISYLNPVYSLGKALVVLGRGLGFTQQHSNQLLYLSNSHLLSKNISNLFFVPLGNIEIDMLEQRRIAFDRDSITIFAPLETDQLYIHSARTVDPYKLIGINFQTKDVKLFHSGGIMFVFAYNRKGYQSEKNGLFAVDSQLNVILRMDIQLSSVRSYVDIVDFAADYPNSVFYFLVRSRQSSTELVRYSIPACIDSKYSTATSKSKLSTSGRVIITSALILSIGILCLLIALVIVVISRVRMLTKQKSELGEKLLDKYADRELQHTIVINFEELEVISKISEGGGGIVYKAVWFQQYVALKRLKVENEDAFAKEVNLLNSLRHPNVLTLYGYSVDKLGEKYIVTEFMQNGNLFELIYNQSVLEFSAKIRILLGIAYGVSYLHSRTPQIVHRDLKPQNILLDSNGNCRICDFGVSKVMDHTATVAAIGTIEYMAPELLGQTGLVSAKCDSYSFGVMMNEIFCCERPYKENNAMALNTFKLGMRIVLEGHRPQIPCPNYMDANEQEITAAFLRSNSLSAQVSSQNMAQAVKRYYKLCTMCWSANPDHRPNFAEIAKDLEGIQNLLKLE